MKVIYIMHPTFLWIIYVSFLSGHLTALKPSIQLPAVDTMGGNWWKKSLPIHEEWERGGQRRKDVAFLNGDKETLPKTIWKAEEDVMIMEMRDEGVDWNTIAQKLKRPQSQCMLRYTTTLLRRFAFTLDEQAAVLDLVTQHGEKWDMIAQKMNEKFAYKYDVPTQKITEDDINNSVRNRKSRKYTQETVVECDITIRRFRADNCRVYYGQFLRSLSSEPWTPEEDKLLDIVVRENQLWDESLVKDTHNMNSKDLEVNSEHDSSHRSLLHSNSMPKQVGDLKQLGSLSLQNEDDEGMNGGGTFMASLRSLIDKGATESQVKKFFLENIEKEETKSGSGSRSMIEGMKDTRRSYDKVDYINIDKDIDTGIKNHNKQGMDALPLFSLPPLNDVDIPRAFARGAPPKWRNISHVLHRSGIDCRRRYCMKILGFSDMEKNSDVWYPGEQYYLMEWIRKWEAEWGNITAKRKAGKETLWATLGRELGRTSSQVQRAYNAIVATNVTFKKILEDDGTVSFVKVAPLSKVWTAEDEALLLSLVSLEKKKADGMEGGKEKGKEKGRGKFGKNKSVRWGMIGKQLGRTGPQCYQRHQIITARMKGTEHVDDKDGRGWNNNNNDNQVAATVGWTAEQKKELSDLVNRMGPRWTSIGKKIGRTAYVCRAAYKRIAVSSGLAMPRYKDLIRNISLSSLPTTTPLIRLPWDKREDDYLAKRVSQIGRRWEAIAEEMKRSPEDVMLRFDFKIAARRQGQWRREEDQLLLKLVNEMTPYPRWAQIGQKLGRTGPQCMLRYRHSLDPRLRWKLWTASEDEQLVSLRDTHGYTFQMISGAMDRAASSLRYRYGKLKEMRRDEESQG